MSIRKRQPKKGKPRYQVVVEHTVAGVRRQTYRTFRRLEDAEKFERDQLSDRDRDVLNLPVKTPLAQYLREWLAAREGQLKATTHHGYSVLLPRYIEPTIGHLPLSELTGRDIDGLYAQMRAQTNAKTKRKLSESTVDHVHKLLSSALRAAVPHLLKRNPLEAVVHPPRPRPPVQGAARAQEVPLLLAAAKGSRYEAGVWLALYTGLRRSELCGLQWADLDLDRRMLTVRRTVQQTGKTVWVDDHKRPASYRTVGLPQALVDYLRTLDPKDGPWVLGGVAHILPDRLSWSFRRIAKKAGVEISLHGSRHTNATLLIQAGVSLPDVSAHLGHANPAITARIYTHAFEGNERTVADAFERALQGPSSA